MSVNKKFENILNFIQFCWRKDWGGRDVRWMARCIVPSNVTIHHILLEQFVLVTT